MVLGWPALRDLDVVCPKSLHIGGLIFSLTMGVVVGPLGRSVHHWASSPRKD